MSIAPARSPLAEQRAAQVEPGQHVLRIEVDGLAQGSDRGVVVAQRLRVAAAAVAVRLHQPRVEARVRARRGGHLDHAVERRDFLARILLRERGLEDRPNGGLVDHDAAGFPRHLPRSGRGAHRRPNLLHRLLHLGHFFGSDVSVLCLVNQLHLEGARPIRVHGATGLGEHLDNEVLDLVVHEFLAVLLVQRDELGLAGDARKAHVLRRQIGFHLLDRGLVLLDGGLRRGGGRLLSGFGFNPAGVHWPLVLRVCVLRGTSACCCVLRMLERYERSPVVVESAYADVWNAECDGVSKWPHTCRDARCSDATAQESRKPSPLQLSRLSAAHITRW